MKKAGVGRATFYLHFKSVDDVYNGVAKWVADIFNSRFYSGHQKFTITNMQEAYSEVFSFMGQNEHFTYALAYTKQFIKVVSLVGERLFESYIQNIRSTTTPLQVVKLNCYISAAGI